MMLFSQIQVSSLRSATAKVMLADEFMQAVVQLAMLRFSNMPPRYAVSELMVQLRQMRPMV